MPASGANPGHGDPAAEPVELAAMNWTEASGDVLADPVRTTFVASAATMATVVLIGLLAFLGRLGREAVSGLRRRLG